MKYDEHETAVPPVPPKKKRGVWWVIKWGAIFTLLLVVILILINFRFPPGKGRPFVRVSPQTTWATSPLKPNGDIDYIAFLNQQYAIPPDQNAFVDLVRILGPKFEGVVFPPGFFEQLGIPSVPEHGDYLENLIWRRMGVDTPISVTLNGVRIESLRVHELTKSVPFAPGEFPAVDKWFQKNEHHLLAIQSAVRKPGYYTPIGGSDNSYTALMGHVQQMRAVVWSMQRSSMLRLGRGDVTGAIDDQIAILRFGRHISRLGTPLEFLFGMIFENMGHDSIAQTVFSGKCTAVDLKRLAAELDSLPPLRSIDKRYLEAERVMMLDLAIGIGRYGPIPWDDRFLGPASPGAMWIDSKPGFDDALIRAAIDWESVCLELNARFDQLDRIPEQSSVLAQAGMYRAADQELDAQGEKTRLFSQFFGWTSDGRRQRGKLISDMLPVYSGFSRSYQFDYWRQALARFMVSRVAIALELFRLEHGEYPRGLDELVPEFLETMPLDPFTEKQLIYRPDEGDPFLLYSIGRNGFDDNGAEFGTKTATPVPMGKSEIRNVDLPAAPEIRTVQEWIGETLKEK